MNISVEYKDIKGSLSNRSFRMTRVAFAKHLAIAGQGYAPNARKFLRTIGMFFHYSYYVQRRAFYADRFSEPPFALSDPTEKGQFSNLAGKAIADFLSKRIDKSLYTVNYEAVMRLKKHKIKGERPDLVAYSPIGMFSIEAKGRNENNPGDMTEHKTQAQSGPISVNFSVACISYNLFNKVSCNYHDPVNENVEYDDQTLQALTKKYYSGLRTFLNEKYFQYREVQIQNERFYEIELGYPNFDKIFLDEFLFRPFWYREIFEFYRPRLILPVKISEFADNGITRQTEPFNYQVTDQNDYIYIDNDRVGLRIRE